MELGKAPMNFKGFGFEVEQTENQAGWKWTVSFDPARMRTGVTKTRSLAVIEAMREIDMERADRANGKSRRPDPDQ
jgi:hypothetical protein